MRNYLFYDQLLKITEEESQLKLISLPKLMSYNQYNSNADLYHPYVIGFDIESNDISNIKLYFNVYSQEKKVGEFSFSIVENSCFQLRNARKIKLEHSLTKEEIIGLLTNEFGITYRISTDIFNYGNIIKSYTGTQDFPYFGGAVSWNNEMMKQSFCIKNYYSFMTKENAEDDFGVYSREKILACIAKIISLRDSNINPLVMRISNHLISRYNALPTLYGINIGNNGDVEQKLYFLIDDQSVDDRISVIDKIYNMLWQLEMPNNMKNMIKTVELSHGKPTEIAIAFNQSKNRIYLKSYFNFEYSP